MNRRQFLKSIGIVLAVASLPAIPFKWGAERIGCITPWVGSKLPKGWIPCDGRTLPVASYPELFVVLGELRNSGWEVGSPEFRLPDYRGTIPRVKPSELPVVVQYLIKTS